MIIISPGNVANNIPVSTASSEPLILPSNEVQENIGGNCCTRKDPSLVELDCFQKYLILIMGIILTISGIVNILVTLIPNIENYNIFISIDIAIILYSIFVCLSVFQIRWLRVTATLLSVIFLVLGIGGSLYQFLLLNSKNSEFVSSSIYSVCKFIFYGRIIWFLLIMNVLFYEYWGIKCLKCEGGSSGGYRRHHRTHFGVHHHFTHHHSRPHHGGGHRHHGRRH